MIQRRYLVIGLLVLTGCAAPKGKAPVETRTIGASQTAPATAKKPPAASGGGASSGPSAPSPPSAADSGGPVPSGFYRVKRGDTLISIALEQGVDWRDLASWNDISNPNVIEVGRLLRILQSRPADAPAPSVAAVPATPGAAQTAPVAGVGAVKARPIEAGSAAGGASAPTPPTVAAAPPATELASAAPPPAAAGLQWAWPAHGQVISGFSEGGSKGVAIAGAQGEAIFAAESGRVIYSGNGLRGYGNLVIVKHDQEFTTAYAHNRAILVKEGQIVRRGQKIAELGMSDADRPMLHFEVRKGGKPVDPLSFLPSR